MKLIEFKAMLLVATLLFGLPPAGQAWLTWVAAPAFTTEAIWAVSVLLPESTAGWRP